MYKIRRYREGDALPLQNVFRNSVEGIGPTDYTSRQVDVWLSTTPSELQTHSRCTDGRITLVGVDENDEAVAYIDLESDGHIDHLYCSPKAAGKGVASNLFNDVEKIARVQGNYRLFTEASEAAKRFFMQKGFALVCRHEFNIDGVTIHNFAMEKKLRD